MLVRLLSCLLPIFAAWFSPGLQLPHGSLLSGHRNGWSSQAVDPGTRQVGERRQVGFGGQPLGLESAHLAGRCRRLVKALAADNGANHRIAGEPLGIVDVFVAGPALAAAAQRRWPFTPVRKRIGWPPRACSASPMLPESGPGWVWMWEGPPARATIASKRWSWRPGYGGWCLRRPHRYGPNSRSLPRLRSPTCPLFPHAPVRSAPSANSAAAGQEMVDDQHD